MNSSEVSGVKYSVVSIASALGSVPLEESGQFLAVIVSVISGIISIVKMLKKPKR